MRELKFRIFNKINKQIFEVVLIDFDNDEVIVKANTNKYWRIRFSINECELMQFTGLHDKNGKEIYEGDIIFYKEPYQENPYESKGFVFFYDGEYITDFGNLREFHDNSEIIGNIHESPELLENK